MERLPNPFPLSPIVAWGDGGDPKPLPHVPQGDGGPQTSSPLVLGGSQGTCGCRQGMEGGRSPPKRGCSWAGSEGIETGEGSTGQGRAWGVHRVTPTAPPCASWPAPSQVGPCAAALAGHFLPLDQHSLVNSPARSPLPPCSVVRTLSSPPHLHGQPPHTPPPQLTRKAREGGEGRRWLGGSEGIPPNVGQ